MPPKPRSKSVARTAHGQRRPRRAQPGGKANIAGGIYGEKDSVAGTGLHSHYQTTTGPFSNHVGSPTS